MKKKLKGGLSCYMSVLQYFEACLNKYRNNDKLAYLNLFGCQARELLVDYEI